MRLFGGRRLQVERTAIIKTLSVSLECLTLVKRPIRLDQSGKGIDRQEMRFYQWPGSQSRGVLYIIKWKTENAFTKCILAVNLPEI